MRTPKWLSLFEQGDTTGASDALASWVKRNSNWEELIEELRSRTSKCYSKVELSEWLGEELGLEFDECEYSDGNDELTHKCPVCGATNNMTLEQTCPCYLGNDACDLQDDYSGLESLFSSIGNQVYVFLEEFKSFEDSIDSVEDARVAAVLRMWDIGTDEVLEHFTNVATETLDWFDGSTSTGYFMKSGFIKELHEVLESAIKHFEHAANLAQIPKERVSQSIHEIRTAISKSGWVPADPGQQSASAGNTK